MLAHLKILLSCSIVFAVFKVKPAGTHWTLNEPPGKLNGQEGTQGAQEVRERPHGGADGPMP